MSHLLDSTLALQDLRLDITDVYVFRGRVGTVLVLGVNNSAGRADKPDGFRPDAHYDFRIDLNGDAIEDRTFRVMFGPPDAERGQALQLSLLKGAEARDHSADGTLLAWGSTGRIVNGAGGLQLWAGLAADPFYV